LIQGYQNYANLSGIQVSHLSVFFVSVLFLPFQSLPSRLPLRIEVFKPEVFCERSMAGRIFLYGIDCIFIRTFFPAMAFAWKS
jgi:hypothetical protein